MKSAAFAAARAQLTATRERLVAQLAELDAAQASDTKSSAGDKYETSRERTAQERAQLSAQLLAAREQLTALAVAERAAPGGRVGLGSYVEVEPLGAVLIATGLGRVRVPGVAGAIAVVSPESPLGAVLRGCRVGEEVEFRGRRLVIRKLF